MKGKPIILHIGDRFGRLTIVKELKHAKQKPRRIQCLCDCGNEKIVTPTHLMTGLTQSCGCLQKERTSEVSRIHGYGQDHLLYRVWKGIKARCFNPTRSAYKHYGGRGITIYKEWKDDPVAFVEWCLANGWTSKLTIDRIDNDGDYEPSNIQFISKSDNSKRLHERRRNVKRYDAVLAALSLPV